MTTPAIQFLEPTINTPDFTRPEVNLFKLARTRCRDLLAGTDAIHAGGDMYLPKWAGEDDDMYRVRSTLTELYNAYGRCVSAARGLVGAKPPQLPADAPEQLQDDWKDIDGQGTHGEVFAMNRFEDGIVEGLGLILVDYPATPPGMRLDEHQKAGYRPYWVPVCTDQIRNWRTAKIDGKTVFSMVTIHEEVDDEIGEFGVSCVDQYRNIRLEKVKDDILSSGLRDAITWRIWRKHMDGNIEKWSIYKEGEYRGPKRIPLAIGYFGRKHAPMVAEPPLSSFAELNIGHYRVSSDRRYLMSIVHAPTLTLEGWTDPVVTPGMPPTSSEIDLGPNSVMKLPNGCTAKWLQAEPDGLDSSKEEKDDLVAQMGSMSIAFLSQERKSQETATAHRINSSAQNATLATAARGEKDLLDDAAEIHCQYLGVDAKPEFTVNTTYDEEQLDSATIVALGGLAKDMNITRKTLLLILQRGKVIPDDINIEDEDAELDQQQQDAKTAEADAAARARALMLAGSSGEEPLVTPKPKAKAPKKRKTSEKQVA